MTDKQIKVLGWLASSLAILMYVSYIPQIIGNLNGNKISFIQPLVVAVNCIVWACYGFFKKDRDLPLVFANIPGIIFGLIAAITAL